MSGNGSFDQHVGSMTMNIGLPGEAAALLGSSLQMSMVLDGHTVYLKLPSTLSSRIPGAKPWVAMDLTQSAGGSGSGLTSLLNSSSQLTDPGAYLDYLRAAAGGSLKYVGPATVNGVPTSEYHGDDRCRQTRRRAARERARRRRHPNSPRRSQRPDPASTSTSTAQIRCVGSSTTNRSRPRQDGHERHPGRLPRLRPAAHANDPARRSGDEPVDARTRDLLVAPRPARLAARVGLCCQLASASGHAGVVLERAPQDAAGERAVRTPRFGRDLHVLRRRAGLEIVALAARRSGSRGRRSPARPVAAGGTSGTCARSTCRCP